MPKIDRSQEQGYFGFPLHWKQAVLQKGGIRTQPSQCSQLGQRSQLLSFRRPILPKYLFCTNWIRTPDFQAQLSHFFREHQPGRQETSYSRTNAFNSRALNVELENQGSLPSQTWSWPFEATFERFFSPKAMVGAVGLANGRRMLGVHWGPVRWFLELTRSGLNTDIPGLFGS